MVAAMQRNSDYEEIKSNKKKIRNNEVVTATKCTVMIHGNCFEKKKHRMQCRAKNEIDKLNLPLSFLV